MDEQHLKQEMRLYAIEYVIGKLYKEMLLQRSIVNASAIEHFKFDFLEAARNQHFPIPDPALAELAATEWEAALKRFLDWI